MVWEVKTNEHNLTVTLPSVETAVDFQRAAFSAAGSRQGKTEGAKRARRTQQKSKHQKRRQIQASKLMYRIGDTHACLDFV